MTASTAAPAGTGLRRPGDEPHEPLWLAAVRLRAARRVLWLRQRWQTRHYEDEQLLAITHSEVDRALEPAEAVRAAERRFLAEDERAAVMSERLSAFERQPPDPRIGRLTACLGLSRFESALLVLTLAAAIEPSLRRVFGYLADLAEPTDPSPALTAALFELSGASPPGPDSALVRWRVAEPVHDGPNAFAPSTGWRIDPLLLRAFADRPDGAADSATMTPFEPDWSAGTIGRPATPATGPVLHAQTLEEIVGFVSALTGAPDAPPLEIELVGAPGAGRITLAGHAAARLGLSLLAVDLDAVGRMPDSTTQIVREARRARLEGAVIAWRGSEDVAPIAWAAIPAAPLAFICVETPGRAAAESEAIRRSVPVGPIGRRERLELWSSLSDLPPPAAVTEWALRPAEIRVAARTAPAGEHGISAVCRRLLTSPLPGLAAPLPLPYTWDDLVVAPRTQAHLQEFEDQIRDRGPVLDTWGFARLTTLGRSVTALFAGPSGTGKTMAAQVIARSLGLELLRIDLAGIVNKYIGETEKHLRLLFDVSERAPVLLLFDEADALFGKRAQVSDAHDRYANIEIDYLLQRMERFDGSAILATNRKSDLDTAFVRRLRFIIDFGPPSPDERERLWRLALEDAQDCDGRPLTDELAWTRLAHDLDLNGAGIKAAALAAAHRARRERTSISQRHVTAAAARELEKQGLVLRPGQWEGR